MQINIHRMLKRAADCQKLTNPEDALSAIVREYSTEAELSENALDLVAAAVKEPTDQQPEQDREKRP